MKYKQFSAKFAQKVWSLFLSGLLVTLPLTLTLSVFLFSFKVILHWLEPLEYFTRTTPILRLIPYPELFLALIIIFGAGIFYRIFILRSIIHAIEHIVTSLPIIRPIYNGIKQLIQAFSIQDQMGFKQVILVQFPREGFYSVGFLTGELNPELSPNTKEKFFNIFIPTTPNPTSGYLVIIPEKDLIPIDITRQEAMAMIISGGIIQPVTHEKSGHLLTEK